MKEFLLILNEYQMEGRYPDYQQRIFTLCTKEHTDEVLEKVNASREWLLSKLL